MTLKHLLPTLRDRKRFVLATIRRLAADGRRPRVVDIGCGEADLHPSIQPFCVSLDGVDANAGDVARAARTNPAGRYRVGEAGALPWPDGAFDAALCLEALEHVADPSAAIGELARVLRPGGTLVLTCPSARFPASYDPLHRWVGRRLLPIGAYAYGHQWLPREEDVRAALSMAGFGSVRVVGLTGWLAAGTEAYWAGLVQRGLKANAANGAGHVGPGLPASSGAATVYGTVGLGFVATRTG